MELNQDQVEILQDLAGFIIFSIRQDKDFSWVISNLGHDISGLLKHETGFLPRTSGYKGHLLDSLKGG